MIPKPTNQYEVTARAKTKRFLARMLTAFFWRHMPASTMAKPAFMKITKIVATSNHRLLARKAAESSGSSSAFAERVKIPSPIRASGAHAIQVMARFELNPRMLFISIIGPSRRLASWRVLRRFLGGAWYAVVMNKRAELLLRSHAQIAFRPTQPTVARRVLLKCSFGYRNQIFASGRLPCQLILFALKPKQQGKISTPAATASR